MLLLQVFDYHNLGSRVTNNSFYNLKKPIDQQSLVDDETFSLKNWAILIDRHKFMENSF